jgi:hypothetical protein
MGAEKLNKKFPGLVLAVQNTTHIVTWFSDPMHGSTIKAASGLKTQRFDAILVSSAILAPSPYHDVSMKLAWFIGVIVEQIFGQGVPRILFSLLPCTPLCLPSPCPHQSE